jgi:assimilatory nitrate reductase catalytic subunit
VILCVCKAVTVRELRAAIARGAVTLEALGEATGAGTDCGTCREALLELIDEHAHRPGAPAPPGPGPSV